MFLPIPQQSWTGGSIHPFVYISTAGEAAGLTPDDITKEYGENIKGTGTVTITGIRKYTGRGDTITGVEGIDASDVASVKYVNLSGMTSDKPFKGVNVVVVTRTDGSTQTTKAVF